MFFEGDFVDEEFAEDGSDRSSSVLFVGRRLRQSLFAELEQELLACEAEKELRFAVDEFVMVRRPAGFVLAKVLRHWDEGSCYRLELQDGLGTNIWASDSEEL